MMIKSKQISSVYDKIAETYAKEFSKPSGYIDEFLTLLPKNAKILDVGCGVGVDADYMTSKDFEVVGVDLSKEMLKLAKQKFPKIDFRQQDIRELDLPQNSFDGVLVSCSLIHIPKKEAPTLLNKFHHMLKENGVIYISLQSGKSEEIFTGLPFSQKDKLFLNIISFNEIKNLLHNAKFSIVKKYERLPKPNELNFLKLFVIAKK